MSKDTDDTTEVAEDAALVKEEARAAIHPDEVPSYPEDATPEQMLDAIQKASKVKAARIEREEIAAFDASEAGISDRVKDMRAQMRSEGRAGGPEAARLQEVGDSLDTLNTVISSALRIPPTTMRFNTQEVTELTDDGVQTRDKLQVGALVSSLLTAQTGATVGSALREVATHQADFRKIAAIMGDEAKRNQVLAAPETVEMLAYRAASVGNYLDRHRETVAQTVAMNIAEGVGDSREEAEVRVSNIVANDAIPLVRNILESVESKGQSLATPVNTILTETILRADDTAAIDVNKVADAGLQAAERVDLGAMLSDVNIAHIHGVMLGAYQENSTLRETLATNAGIKNAVEFEKALGTVDKALGMVGHHQEKLLTLGPAIVALVTDPEVLDPPDLTPPVEIIPQIIATAGKLVEAIDDNPENITSVAKILDAVAPPGPTPDFEAQVLEHFNPARVKYRGAQRQREETLESAKAKEVEVSNNNSAIEAAEAKEAEAVTKIEALEAERRQLQHVRDRQQRDIDSDMKDPAIAGLVHIFDDRKKLLEETVAAFKDNPIQDAPPGSNVTERHAVRSERASRRKLEDELKRLNEGVLDAAKDQMPHTAEARAQRVISNRKAILVNDKEIASLDTSVLAVRGEHQAAHRVTEAAKESKAHAVQEAQTATKAAEQEVKLGAQAETDRVASKVSELKAAHEASLAKAKATTLPEILGSVKEILGNEGFKDTLVANADDLAKIATPFAKNIPIFFDTRTREERASGAVAFDMKSLDAVAPLAAGAIEVAASNSQVLDHVNTLIETGVKTKELDIKIASATESDKVALETEKAQLSIQSAAALGGVFDVAKDVLKNPKVKGTLVDQSESVGAVAAQIVGKITSKKEKARVEAEYLKEVGKESGALTKAEKDELVARQTKSFVKMRNSREAISNIAAGAVEVVGATPEIIDNVKDIIQTGVVAAEIKSKLQEKKINSKVRKGLQARLQEIKSKNNTALVTVIKSAKAVLDNPKFNETLQKNGDKIVDVVATFLPEEGIVTRKMIEESKPAISNVLQAVAQDTTLVDTVANAIETLDKGGIFQKIGAFRDIARNKDLNNALRDNSQGLADVAAKIFVQGRDTSKLSPEQQSKALQADAKKTSNLLKAVADLHQPTWNPFKKVARFSRVAFNALRLTGSITKLVKHIKEEKKNKEAAKIAALKSQLNTPQIDPKAKSNVKVKQETLAPKPKRGSHTARLESSRARSDEIARSL